MITASRSARLVLAWLLAVAPIAAADEPCRATGTSESPTVTCTKPGFDVLVRKIIDTTAERDVLKVKLDAMTAERDDVKTALDACVAKPPPEPVVIKPTAMEKVGPVVLGILGAGVLGVTSMMDGATAGRAIGAVVGFLSVGAGLYWAVP